MPTGMIAGSLAGAVQQGMGEDAALDTGPKTLVYVSWVLHRSEDEVVPAQSRIRRLLVVRSAEWRHGAQGRLSIASGPSKSFAWVAK